MNPRTSKPAGDEVAGASTATAAASVASDTATEASTAIAASPQPTPTGTDAPKAKPEKALSEPDDNPAIPRDEFHGRGGAYALVGGKRVPVDEDGKPLPAKK